MAKTKNGDKETLVDDAALAAEPEHDYGPEPAYEPAPEPKAETKVTKSNKSAAKDLVNQAVTLLKASDKNHRDDNEEMAKALIEQAKALDPGCVV